MRLQVGIVLDKQCTVSHLKTLHKAKCTENILKTENVGVSIYIKLMKNEFLKFKNYTIDDCT